jgi:hypothetical protein
VQLRARWKLAHAPFQFFERRNHVLRGKVRTVPGSWVEGDLAQSVIKHIVDGLRLLGPGCVAGCGSAIAIIAATKTKILFLSLGKAQAQTITDKACLNRSTHDKNTLSWAISIGRFCSDDRWPGLK